MLEMDGKTYETAVIRKKQIVKTLADLNGKVPGVSKKYHLDSNILFTRLIAIAQRTSSLESYFAYELAPVPYSLFSDSFIMRKTDKSRLARELTKSATNVDRPKSCTVVIDGGWLLHKVKWQQGGVYADVVQQYVGYIHSHFGQNVFIVFDDYMNGPRTKDHEHLKRAVEAAPDIAYDPLKPLYCNQAKFLRNEVNKKSFVDHLMT